MERNEYRKILYIQLGVYLGSPSWLAMQYMDWVLYCDTTFKITK